ncbi:hypothetical protein EVAR_24609_1 [Eumeta japonica]|uniref:Uncharacterized protein n=1 Tax=Eumeta variegata TaxID=151549 RepID=A0A4C1V2G7_EUMVA|nr:hypothetical protein EVAR_24609_1 [Eumeta japonica]
MGVRSEIKMLKVEQDERVTQSQTAAQHLKDKDHRFDKLLQSAIRWEKLVRKANQSAMPKVLNKTLFTDFLQLNPEYGDSCGQNDSTGGKQIKEPFARGAINAGNLGIFELAIQGGNEEEYTANQTALLHGMRPLRRSRETSKYQYCGTSAG